MPNKLIVLRAGSNPRLEAILPIVLRNRTYDLYRMTQPTLPNLQKRRILFVLAVDEGGINEEICRLLAALRKNPQSLEQSAVAIWIDGVGELYTKELGRMLTFAANSAGAWLMGKPLLEATGSLQNLAIRAKNMNRTPQEAYPILANALIDRLLAFNPPKFDHCRLLMLHASNQKTSNTLALGNAVCKQLSPSIQVNTICLRNGTVYDCKGCSYKVCAHFAQQQDCFYGGTVVNDVFPAILESDILMFLCPNYNDAIGANLMALINRFTSLMVNNRLEGKLLFGIVASGYSGGDIVAQQLLGALCLNKSIALPPRCCMLVTANDPGQAMAQEAIDQRIEAFAQRINSLSKSDSCSAAKNSPSENVK